MAKVVDVSDCSDIPVLFSLAANQHSEDHFACFEAFLRRVSVTADFLTVLQEYSFFNGFIDGIERIVDPAVIISWLRTVEELGKIGFVPEFLWLRKSLKKFLRGTDEVASAALFALRELTAHRRMASGIVGKGFEDFLSRFDDGEERRAARRVLSDLHNAESTRKS
jgi:hypothetical protein